MSGHPGAACGAAGVWVWAALALCGLPMQAAAAEEAPAAGADVAASADGPAFKLTLGHVRLRGGDDPVAGTDVNLRWRGGDHTVWLGLYEQGGFGRQLRAGWDDHWALSEALGGVQLLPSLQLASGGFVGGSLALQAGGPVFVQAGMGRTNLRPYANLNFDPNDALSLALGWQGDGDRQLMLSAIADDRLGTHQQHHHLTLRWPLPASWRLSADLLHKQGLGDTGPVRAWGWSLGLDGPRWFGRLARDPKQNFSAQDAWRLSGGARF